jgi:hypothetical protein
MRSVCVVSDVQLRKQRLQDFYDAEKEAGEGRRTFSGGSC